MSAPADRCGSRAGTPRRSEPARRAARRAAALDPRRRQGRSRQDDLRGGARGAVRRSGPGHAASLHRSRALARRRVGVRSRPGRRRWPRRDHLFAMQLDAQEERDAFLRRWRDVLDGHPRPRHVPERRGHRRVHRRCASRAPIKRWRSSRCWSSSAIRDGNGSSSTRHPPATRCACWRFPRAFAR